MTTQAQREFVDIIGSELGACPDKDRILTIPSLEHGWVHGVPSSDRSRMIAMDDDLSWWFVAAFKPEDMPLVRRMFNAVPEFFGDLAKLQGALGGPPVRLDWNLIHHLRRRLLRQLWPTAYEVAVSATDGRAGKASEMLKRLTTAEQWRARS